MGEREVEYIARDEVKEELSTFLCGCVCCLIFEVNLRQGEKLFLYTYIYIFRTLKEIVSG